MFYDRFCSLCDERKLSRSAVLSEVGLSTGNFKNWKNGRIPKVDVLNKLSDYFGVSVEYLLGSTDLQSADRSELTDADIKFALFGGDSEFISDEAFEDVRRFAAIVAEKERRKVNGGNQ